MAATFQHLDLDLRREILLRTEEIMGSNGPKGPDKYHFEGYGLEMVKFNIRKLPDNELNCAREWKEKRRGVINCWPELLYDKGLDFLESTRSEVFWKEVLGKVEAKGVTPILKRMKETLLEFERTGEAI